MRHYPSEEEIESAFRLWYGWFDSTTSGSILPPTLPSHVPFDEIDWEKTREALERAKRKIEEAGGRVRDLDLGDIFEAIKNADFSVSGLLDAVMKIGRKVLELRREVIGLIDAVFEDIAAYGASVATGLLNIIYKKIYAIYLLQKKLIVFAGLGFPSRVMLGDSRVRHMNEPHRYPDATGRFLSSRSVAGSYPVQAMPHVPLSDALGDWVRGRSGLSTEGHLIYPLTNGNGRIEKKSDNGVPRPAPRAYEDRDPSFYMIDNGPPTSEMLGLLNELARAEPAATAAVAARLEAATVAPDLGNARDLTIALAAAVRDGRGEEFSLPNLNLDADRGIASPSWILGTESLIQVTQSGKMATAVLDPDLAPDREPQREGL